MTTPLALILIATIAQFILGALWYGPFFGKLWMRIMGAHHHTPEEMAKMQKAMAPYYGLQFILAFVTTCVLALFIQSMPAYSAYVTALVVAVGFIIPTQISAVIWANTEKKFWVRQIGILVSNQLVGLMLAAYILTL